MNDPLAKDYLADFILPTITATIYILEPKE